MSTSIQGARGAPVCKPNFLSKDLSTSTETSLLDLPPELIEQIGKGLSLDSLNNFRLVCKDWSVIGRPIQKEYLRQECTSLLNYLIEEKYLEKECLVYKQDQLILPETIAKIKDHILNDDSALTELSFALYAAPKNKDINNFIRFLIFLGANPNIENNFHETPLTYLIENGCQTVVVKLLLDHGADPKLINGRGETPLCVAARYGRTEVMELLYTYSDDLNQTESRETPLIEAVLAAGKCTKKVASIRCLLDHGADPNKKDCHGDKTPLHYVAERGSIEMTKALLSHRANLKLKDKKGKTALDLARRKGYSQLEALLHSAMEAQFSSMCTIQGFLESLVRRNQAT